MTTKQAKRYFHRNARVLSTGRWAINYCRNTWYAKDGRELLEGFLSVHDECRRLRQREWILPILFVGKGS